MHNVENVGNVENAAYCMEPEIYFLKKWPTNECAPFIRGNILDLHTS